MHWHLQVELKIHGTLPFVRDSLMCTALFPHLAFSRVFITVFSEEWIYCLTVSIVFLTWFFFQKENCWILSGTRCIKGFLKSQNITEVCWGNDTNPGSNSSLKNLVWIQSDKALKALRSFLHFHTECHLEVMSCHLSFVIGPALWMACSSDRWWLQIALCRVLIGGCNL